MSSPIPDVATKGKFDPQSSGSFSRELEKVFRPPVKDTETEEVRKVFQTPNNDWTVNAPFTTTGAQTMEFNINCPNKMYLDFKNVYLSMQLKFHSTGTTAVAITDALNVAASFNMIDEAILYIDDRMVQRVTNPAMIDQINQAIYGNRDALENPEQWYSSWNDLTYDSQNGLGYSAAYAGGDKMLLATANTTLADGKLLELKYHADTGVPTWSTYNDDDHKGKVAEITFQSATTPARGAGYYGENKIGILRRQTVIDGRGYNAAITGATAPISYFTYRIPLSFFFTLFQLPTDHFLLPCKSFKITLRRQPDYMHLIGATAWTNPPAQNIHYLGSRLELTYYRPNSSVSESFLNRMKVDGTKIYIPFLQYKINSSRDAKYDSTSITEQTQELGAAYLLHMFYRSDRTDPLQWSSLSSSSASTVAGHDKLGTKFSKKITYGGVQYPAQENLSPEQYFDMTTNSIAYAYQEFTGLVRYLNPNAHGRIMTMKEWRVKPIFATRLNPSLKGEYTFSNDLKTLLQELSLPNGGYSNDAGTVYGKLIWILAKESVYEYDLLEGGGSVVFNPSPL